MLQTRRIVYSFRRHFGEIVKRRLQTDGQRRSNLKVLGIETSCDDTGIAIVDEDGRVYSEVCASQTALHVSNGGIIPPVARDMHRTMIDRCVVNAFAMSQVPPSDISAVAVTLRPGLPLSLAVGCRYAKNLSAKYNLPVIPIHHMEAHALVAMLEYSQLDFPYLALLISGGHCILVYVNDINDFRLMGQSFDAAPGDILDKLARALRLKNLGQPYNMIPGGAAIELLAKEGGGNPFAYFERAISYPYFSSRLRTCNFSFSGLQTMVLRQISRLEREADLPPDAILPQAADICASVLYLISFILIKRTQRAYQFLEEKELIPDFQPKRLVISGGCAANKFIQKMFTNYCNHEGIEMFVPSSKRCTDNGTMIAWNGVLKLRTEYLWPESVLHDPQVIQRLDIESKAPLGIDISRDVTNANIKCERINIKNFVNFI